MPPKKTYKKKAAAKPRRKAVPRQTALVRAPTQHATITETRPQVARAVNVVYQEQFNIQDFPRALEVAKSFKFYRAKSVKYIYTPEYNTFNAQDLIDVPFLRVVMNRTGDQTSLTVGDISAMGAVPRTFSKMQIVKYKPNLAQTIGVFSTAGNTQDQLGLEPKYDAWLATKALVNQLAPPVGASPSATAMYNCPWYLGHYAIMSQDGASDPIVGHVEIEVVWEFKGPQPPATRTTP